MADHSAINPSDAGIHLKGQFDEVFFRNNLLEQQKIKIFKLENDLKTKSEDVIALSANLKQLSDRTDIQTLMNENRELSKLNHELKQKAVDKQGNIRQKNYILMYLIAIVAIIVGVFLGRLL
ncbi:hypothetical protein R5L37_08925 [Acinetobacter pittii]|uniref:hypothetical protein n=1 Tax=Acinetobacter pittii TaxID=48296 RepID=UPI002953678B|nr:hypothetical protein [Acinetobacter pittii]MDV8151884.1 hypothetical protein [Acinetobacter pittii]